jgi:enterochelin esterase-like enzyme
VLRVSRLSAVLGALSVAAVLAPAAAEAQAPAVVSPEVVHTGTAPTGYEVTFRVHDPSATRMRIKGEWSFSSAADWAASPPNNVAHSPSQWRPGDFPLQSPNGPNANWPVTDMVKNEATGVWSFTTPLPSGVFSYQFFRDCDAAAPVLTGCVASSDPANPPWNSRGSIERFSQIYVPSDPAFGTVDYSWQAAAPAGQRGTLADVSYPSPLSTDPDASHDLAVYLPPGYDPNRAKPYPLFILSHGGGEHEVDWSTQGRLGPIVDNLIAAGKMQPAVVAMTNFQALAGAEPGYASDVRNAVIPFMEKNYNVTASASGRAFAGTSGGATRANELLFKNTTAFGYVGVWSAPRGLPAAGDPAFANPDLKKLLGLHLAIGIQDVGGLAGQNMADEQSRLAAAGVPFVVYKVDGGHTWSFWRGAIRDYLTRVAFRATTTGVVANVARKKLIATVAPATSEPATPTGTVQFMADGKPLGKPVTLKDGKARLAGHTASGSKPWWRDAASTVSAVYSGDTLYNASTSSSVTVIEK